MPDAPTEVIAPVRSPRRAVWWAVAVLGLLGVAYLIDLAATRDDVPRGVSVAGVPIGGLSRADAERTLRARLEPGLRRDVAIRAGTVRTTLTPRAAGLAVDWPGTVAAVADQPLNPLTRLRALFATTDHPVVTSPNGSALGDALDGVASLVRKPPTDGGVRFEGGRPVPVPAVPGAELDLPAAVNQVLTEWTRGAPVELPVQAVEPPGKVGDQAINRAINEVARPAVSATVRVRGEGDRIATLSPEAIAGALGFAPDGSGGLKPVIDVPKLADAVRPQLAATEQPAKDATLRLVGTLPVVQPSVDGRGVDYQATFSGLADILRRATDREVTAIYTHQPAKLTTEEVAALGIRDQVSTFGTGGFAADSGVNIRRAAASINGTVVRPGETFSLNTATGPRDAPQGYVPAGIIENNHPAKGIGGGVSQLATTLYNAAYFAGMTDVAHREHSYYIGRYPAAREATVFEGSIDLKFRNDLPNAVFLQTAWTPASITVTFWGTKRYEVTSATSPKTNPVPPPTLTMPAGKDCTPSAGGQGFTATDTRTMRDLASGEVKTTNRTVHYKPSPKVVCAGP